LQTILQQLAATDGRDIHNAGESTFSIITYNYGQLVIEVVYYYTFNNNKQQQLTKSRDCTVGIATGYGLDDRGVGVRVPVGSRTFFSPRRPDWV
jgi:hypothetical protein